MLKCDHCSHRWAAEWAAALALVALGTACAQTPAAPETAVYHLPGGTGTPDATAAGSDQVWTKVPDGPRRDGLMWKVSSGSGDTYLVGSLHSASGELYPLPDQIEKAFRKSSALVVELDINQVGAQRAHASVQNLGRYPSGDNLWNHISASTRESVERFCTERHIDPARFATYKPWALSLAVAAIAMTGTGVKNSLGIDQYFLDRAPRTMQVRQVESWDFQLRMLANLSAHDQEQMLIDAIRDPNKARRESAELQAAWLDGDAERLASVGYEGFAAEPGARKAILSDRNPHMADAVEDCVKGGVRCFVIVGALHLVGPDGIVNLLRNRGYSVAPVRASQ